ncbi:MAG: hypothetical protein PHC38_10510 [Weeksellaceae bacterium]|nr:hypothetical protein [Weeksellaceae bacterium]
MLHLVNTISFPKYNTNNQVIKDINKTIGIQIVLNIFKLLYLKNNNAWEHWVGELVGHLTGNGGLSRIRYKNTEKPFPQIVYFTGIFEEEYGSDMGKENFVQDVKDELYDYFKEKAYDIPNQKIMEFYKPVSNVITVISEMLSSKSTKGDYYNYLNSLKQ